LWFDPGLVGLFITSTLLHLGQDINLLVVSVSENWVAADSEFVTNTTFKGQWKLSRCWLRNHQRKTFHRWRLDSWEHMTPFDTEIVNKNWAAADFEIINETASTGDAWIHQRLQHLFTQKNSTKTESVPTRKSSTKHLPKVTRGFVNAPRPVDLETVNENWATIESKIVNKTDSKSDVWIRQRPQPLLTNK
jgi:hypothetical protein